MTYIFSEDLEDDMNYEITLGFADTQYMCGSGEYFRSIDVDVNGESFVSDLNLEETVGCNNAYVVSGIFQPKESKFLIKFVRGQRQSLKPIVSFVSVKPIVEENTTS